MAKKGKNRQILTFQPKNREQITKQKIMRSIFYFGPRVLKTRFSADLGHFRGSLNVFGVWYIRAIFSIFGHFRTKCPFSPASNAIVASCRDI